MNIRFSVDIHTLRRFIQNQHRWFCLKPATQCDLLLISAGETGDRREDRRSFDVKPIHIIDGNLSFVNKIKRTETSNLSERRQRDIRAHRHLQDYAVTRAVFRKIGEALLDSMRRSANCNWRSAQRNLSVVCGINSKEHSR